MAENQLPRLKKLRGSIKRQLTYFENVLKSINEETDLTSLDIEGRLAKHITCWDEFKEIQDKIDDLSTGNDGEAENESERLHFQNRLYAISGLAKSHLKALLTCSTSSTSATPQNSTSCLPSSRFELPKLQTPLYYGSYNTWLNFYESFKSMCHDNVSIPDLHKFYYLKACLKGEAAEVISSLESTTKNYTIAWELLKRRYDNRRAIVEKYLKSLMETPRVSKEFSTCNLLDNMQKQVRAVKALVKAEDRCDALLVFIVKEKLNNYTREKWEENFKGTNIPSFDDVISFLEERALIDCSQFNQKQNTFQRNDLNKSTSKFHPSSKHTQSCMQTSVNSQNNTTKPTCPICKENHMPLSCSSFHKMSPHERYLEIKKTSLCHNCLNGHHRTIECKAVTCKKCKKNHHVLLHFERKPILSENSTLFNSESTTQQLLSCQSQASSHIVLGTAIVDILNNKGELQPCMKSQKLKLPQHSHF